MAVIDRIKYDGPTDGSSWLIYKVPSDKFVLGSQLIVNQGQEALFLKGGEVMDLFCAGTHTLKTGNLPLLNKITNLPFGGKTPFTAEIYYVNKTSKLNMNWGTTNPIPFEDPKYGLLLSVRARGQYGIFINDSRLFVSRIIGAVPDGATADHIVIARYFSGLINSKIKSITAEFMIKNRISFLEITAYLDNLSKECKNAISEEFDRFGVEILNFYVESISPPKEEYLKLQGYKEELALGMEFYTKRRSIDNLDKLADNQSSGSMAGTAMGLGVAVGIGNRVADAFSQMSNQIHTNGPKVDNGAQICAKCNENNEKDSNFCKKCGSQFVSYIFCSNCGDRVSSDSNFCKKCGKNMGGGNF